LSKRGNISLFFSKICLDNGGHYTLAASGKVRTVAAEQRVFYVLTQNAKNDR
jgi:hypothetical protein